MNSKLKTKQELKPKSAKTRRLTTRFGIEPAQDGCYRVAAVRMARGRVHSFDVEMVNPNLDAGEQLKRLHYREGLPAVLAIPRHETILKWLRLPTSDPRQIAQMIPFEARAISPWPEQEMIFAYQVTDADSDGSTSVTLVLARKETIENHLAQLHRMGVRATRVELATFSLGRLVADLGDDERPAIVRADGISHEFSRYWAGHPLFSRGAGSEQSTTVFLDESLVLDTRRHGTDQACTLLVLATADPPAAISGVRVLTLSEFHPPVLNGLAALTAESMACIGAALGADLGAPSENLLPERERRRLLVRAVAVESLQVAGAVLLAIALAYLLTSHLIRAERRFAADARTQIQELRGDVGNLDQQSAQVHLLQQEMASVSTPLNLVMELYKRVPASVAISYMHYSADRPIVLSGEAAGFAAVNELLASLNSSPAFDQVQLSHTSRAQQGQSELVEFRITLRYLARSKP